MVMAIRNIDKELFKKAQKENNIFIQENEKGSSKYQFLNAEKSKSAGRELAKKIFRQEH